MRNIKFISIFAACGFVLSFVFGLFSHSSFLLILLRALLCSVIFVVLGLLISFIFQRFLLDSNTLGFESEDVNDSQQKNSTNSKKPGQVIDVVVEDEELPASESDNHFVVGSNAQMLKKTDIGETLGNNRGDDNSANSSFVPLKGFENVSQAPAQGSSDVTSPKEGVKSNDDNGKDVEQSISDDDLDVLPDMENLSVTDEEDDSNNVSQPYTDTEFVSSANFNKKSGSSGPDIKDAALIAKAISTALSEEN